MSAAVKETVVVRQPRNVSVDDLDEALLGVFAQCRDALTAGDSVLVVLDELDLLGHGEPINAAVAHGLVGLVRAFAVEGVKDGWQINAMTLAEGSDPTSVDDLAPSLKDATGVVLRLGTTHLGRIGI
jgi:hypothetical protein